MYTTYNKISNQTSVKYKHEIYNESPITILFDPIMKDYTRSLRWHWAAISLKGIQPK